MLKHKQWLPIRSNPWFWNGMVRMASSHLVILCSSSWASASSMCLHILLFESRHMHHICHINQWVISAIFFLMAHEACGKEQHLFPRKMYFLVKKWGTKRGHWFYLALANGIAGKIRCWSVGSHTLAVRKLTEDIEWVLVQL